MNGKSLLRKAAGFSLSGFQTGKTLLQIQIKLV